jgi:VWFA-related protein
VTIRTTTTLVQVGVSAQDSHGHAITDLKREEFELLDNGKPQSIAVFYNQTTEGATAAAATPTPPQEPAGRFTNRIPGNAAARGGYSVILLDWANTGFRNTARAREQARAVMNRLGPAERIGLYSLDRTGLKVVNEIGSSREAILKSLKTLTGMPAPCYQEQLDGADATSLNSTDDSMKYVGGGQYMCGGPGYLSGEIKQFYEAQRIRNTLEAFEGIAVHLAGFPGRKALIWVSSAFPLVIPLRDPGTAAFGFHIGGYQYLTEDVDQAVRKLNDAEVAVYPVDARGVSSVALVGGGGDPDAAEIVGTDRFTWPTMDEVAKRTGGIAFYGRNNLDAGIQAAIDDAVAGYTLGFYAPQDRTQAGFHKLTVRSLRPGVTLRYKEGYYVDVPENIANGDRPEAVGVALTAITDATAIPIDVQAWRQENTLTLRVFLRPDTLALQRNGDRWQGAVDFIARFAKEDGSECATPASWRVEFNLTQQSYDAGMQGGRRSQAARAGAEQSIGRNRYADNSHGDRPPGRAGRRAGEHASGAVLRAGFHESFRGGAGSFPSGCPPGSARTCEIAARFPLHGDGSPVGLRRPADPVPKGHNIRARPTWCGGDRGGPPGTDRGYAHGRGRLLRTAGAVPSYRNQWVPGQGGLLKRRGIPLPRRVWQQLAEDIRPGFGG